MRYRSTRGHHEIVRFREALVAGLAPDGGLYSPVEIPTLPTPGSTIGYREAVNLSLRLFGAEATEEIVSGAAERFHHPEVAPVIQVGDRLVLELFHGPTLSFKDHALQVVARLLAREVESGVIVGATSGDTGSAAIEAARGNPSLRVVILYPEGRVSDFQRRQMTTVPDRNISAVAVRGTFDDCQRMVKEALLNDPTLLAVNSINFGRIAAQVGFYIHAGLVVGKPFDVVVPTGNFGNVYSAWLAKQMGVGITQITISNNSNHYLADLVNAGAARSGEVIPTLAPAMDIQVPSNLERFTGDPSKEFRASWSGDSQIMATITQVEELHGYRLDPHTATAWSAGDESRSDRPQLVVATAHPSKFDATISPPDWFESPEDSEERITVIDARTSELESLIR